VNRAQFEQLVAEVLAELPPQFQEKLENVAVVVESWPTPAALHQAGLRPGQTLFGLYQGVPRTQRTSSYNLVPPDKITIYQGPIEAHARTTADIRAQVRKTVLHELGHYFGMSEEHLHSLGV